MPHVARVENGLVTDVIVAPATVPDDQVEAWAADFALHVDHLKGGDWKRTSYNGNYRKNFAGIGHAFDEQRNAFIPPMPSPDAILDEKTCRWLVTADAPPLGTKGTLA